MELSFLDAGHVLGSAMVVLDIEDEGEKKRLVFTGDLGRKHLPILRDPEVPEGTNYLICESTYGDRLHRDIAATAEELADVVNRTVARGGKVIIPSFALERAQEVIYALRELRQANRVAPVPVYVDSPLTVRLTEVFRNHPECYDEEAYDSLRSDRSPLDFEGLEYVTETERSIEITRSESPAIVISASGMCEAGRILHHLRATIGDERNTVMIVGYQAKHTLGRRLVEGRSEVRIFGVMHYRDAEVVVLNGLSAHADQKDLVHFMEATRSKGNLEKIFLVHGDEEPQETLKSKLSEKNFDQVFTPGPGERIRLRG